MNYPGGSLARAIDDNALDLPSPFDNTSAPYLIKASDLESSSTLAPTVVDHNVAFCRKPRVTLRRNSAAELEPCTAPHSKSLAAPFVA